MRRPLPESELYIAYHEAGHAVWDYRIGNTIKRVTLEEEDDRILGVVNDERTPLGAVLLECFAQGIVPDQSKEAEVLEHLVGFWTGPAAQMKYQPESVRAVHSESDLYKIRRCVDVIARWSPRRKGGLI